MVKDKPATRGLLEEYFQRNPQTDTSVIELVKKFPEFKRNLIVYYVDRFVNKEKLIIRSGYGRYKLNPKYKSPEQHRAAITEGIRSGTFGSQVQPSGEGWAHGKESLVVKTEPLDENKALVSDMARRIGESIVYRMKMQTGVFAPEDTDFISTMLKKQYPLSEQQAMVIAAGGIPRTRG